MSRKPAHTADSLLDAAAKLAATDGAAAVTMSAVASAAGAPSGSVYYRFPDRSALLAALWLRTLDRFQSGFLAALRIDPPQQAVIQAAHHVTDWSLRNPTDAAVLLAGPDALGSAQWRAESHEAAATRQRGLDDAVGELADRLGYRDRSDRERLALLIIDLPYAAVRRCARAANADLAHTAEAVDRIVRDAMAGAPPAQHLPEPDADAGRR
ncbi:helix-turn-helix transcriptional regulator [Nocardia tengchongensis]|uniref:Helix-turn-helix transcriptional regulator n=1 Tax=Nocardia tengchongensis TaxID=2055889 RepID=A0ABX8CTC8_9NOCA|nr:TetR/AcrR family transcriptional regulator [Nocardia tengchongensis]QVI21445.1 helix-turn-helix transcriptional regulator [Nocardia tengchongensis]